jgi:hypothetical protein
MAIRKLEDPTGQPKLYPVMNDTAANIGEPAIPGGYYIMARKISESEICHAAPCIRELWHWLIRQVNYKPNPEIRLNRGQCVRTIADMQEGLHWHVGYRKETYSKAQCEGALEFLRKRLMITTTKTTRGLIITICKYDFYNNPNNYEDNSEGNKKPTRKQQQPSTINKKDKEEEESKESVAKPVTLTAKAFYANEVSKNADAVLIVKYKNFIDYLHGKNEEEIVFERVMTLKNQLTYKQYVKLREKIIKHGVDIYEVFKGMENKKGLENDNSSLYLTANNWVNFRIENKAKNK